MLAAKIDNMTVGLLDIIARFELRKATIQDLSEWATEILLQGKDTPAVVLLAGITQAESKAKNGVRSILFA